MALRKCIMRLAACGNLTISSIDMTDRLKKSFIMKSAEIRLFASAFFKWIGISVLIGVAAGLIGSAFYLSVAKVTALRHANDWLIYLLPVGGLVIAAAYHFSRTEGEGTDDIIDSILLGRSVKIILLPVIFISTVITHLLGGSAGREGAALQIGGSLGCNIGRVLGLDDKEERLAVLSGMSALFAALFGTPVTAAVFALEVCSVGIVHYSGLVPCAVSSVTAFGITRLFGIAPTHFAVSAIPYSTGSFVSVAILAALCAVLSILFCELLHASGKLAGKLLPNSFIRAFLGGCLLIGMTLLSGCRDYNGGGVETIVSAIESGAVKPEAFALKMLFTAVTMAFGFKGGEIVPTFFIGSAFGCVIGPLLGLPAGFSAAIGLAALFCGAVNCPIASLFLAIEIFGSDGLLYFAVACFISYMLSGYTSLYHEQKIIYSKLKAEYVNIKAD